MFDKLGAAKQMADEMKQKLDSITVSGEAQGIKVVATANRKISEVQIADELLSPDRKEELQELLVVAINRAMESAENVSESEMRAMMGSMLPGIGSLFGK